MADLYVSWAEYHQNIERLAVKVYQSHWDFNQIVCLARGGLRVGDLLSRLYRQPLAILAASSYYGGEGRSQGNLTFSENLTMTNKELGDRILLVDDLVDSGVTLQESAIWLQKRYPGQIAEVRTAVIWYKASSIVVPDYYVEYLRDNPWIHQPFEVYEQVSLAELAGRDLARLSA